MLMLVFCFGADLSTVSAQPLFAERKGFPAKVKECKSKQKTVELSIIIPTLNTGQYHGELIEQLLGVKDIKLVVIVVDNGSADNTLTIAQRYQQHGNLYVFEQARPGAGRARNTGGLWAEGTYMMF